jgi:hypothetical protein
MVSTSFAAGAKARAAAVSVAIAGAIVTAAPAQANCEDPGQLPCPGLVPTADQVVAVMAELTDPGKPAASKTDIVTPGFSPEEADAINDHLNQTNADGLLPYTFVVTDIQPAANNFAGVTVTVTGSFNQHSAPQPIVLADQGGHWLITHDSATTMLNNFWKNANRHPAPHYLHRGPAI